MRDFAGDQERDPDMAIQVARAEVEALINQRLRSGAFKDAEDVILQALRPFPPGMLRATYGASPATTVPTGGTCGGRRTDGLVGVVAGDPLRHRHVLGFDKCGGTPSNSGSAYSS